MRIVAIDIDLPVEDVVEVRTPMHKLAGPGAKERVVIAEESRLAVVGHADVIPAIRPEDVVADVEVSGPAGRHNVAGRRTDERIADHLDMRSADDRQRRGVN